MTFGQVNNTGREMMAVICRWFQDTCGVLLATGLHYDAASNAYGYRLNTTRNVPIDLTTRVRFRIPQTNVGATWLALMEVSEHILSGQIIVSVWQTT